MREKIDCFLPCDDLEAAQHTVKQLRGNKTIQHIFLLVTELLSAEDSKRFKDCQQILVDNLSSSNTMMSIAENANAEYALLQTKQIVAYAQRHLKYRWFGYLRLQRRVHH